MKHQDVLYILPGRGYVMVIANVFWNVMAVKKGFLILFCNACKMKTISWTHDGRPPRVGSKNGALHYVTCLHDAALSQMHYSLTLLRMAWPGQLTH